MSDSPADSPKPEVPPAQPPTGAAAPAATETGLSQEVAAGLSTFFPPVAGIVFFILEKKNAFVRFHALQAIYLGAVLWIGFIGLSFIGSLFGLVPVLNLIVGLILMFLFPLLGVGVLILWVIQAFKAFSGVEWEIPLIGKYVRQHLATGKFPFVK
ncbi:MAG TPA: hypothetical protein VIT91_12045 [Chthoniobacterales bacterium]